MSLNQRWHRWSRGWFWYFLLPTQFLPLFILTIQKGVTYFAPVDINVLSKKLLLLLKYLKVAIPDCHHEKVDVVIVRRGCFKQWLYRVFIFLAASCYFAPCVLRLAKNKLKWTQKKFRALCNILIKLPTLTFFKLTEFKKYVCCKGREGAETNEKNKHGGFFFCVCVRFLREHIPFCTIIYSFVSPMINL